MKIKSISTFVLSILVSSVLVTSCKKYLDVQPISSFGPETVFGSVANAQKAVLGVYQELTGDQGYGIRISMYYPYDNDLMMGASGDNDNDRRDIARYNLAAGNLQLTKPFNQLYEGVERANQCIKYIPQMDLYKNGSAQQQGELKRLYGEALTLRAQFYFELVRNWGDVPAQWVPSADEPDLFLGKTDRDSIYDHVLGDLQTAEDLVPWRSGINALGDPTDERITKGAVKGLRARFALFAGGYSLRKDNQMERPTNYLNYYKIADAECSSIIQSGEHTLDPSFQDLWQNQIDAHRIDTYGEVMFQVAMSGGTGATDSKLGYFNGPRTNGKGNSSLFILPTYFYLFDSLDLRRDVTCAPFEINSDLTYKGHPSSTIIDGKFRRNWISNPTVDPTNNAQYFGINWPILRYSDVLLMYAEAENEINNGPTAGGLQAFQQVRRRGFVAHEDMMGTPPSDKQGFFEAIVRERAFELGDEGIRKYDLIRWNMLGTKLGETKTELAAMAARQPPYDALPATMYYLNGSTSLIWGNSFYQLSPATTPSGYSGVDWIGSGITSAFAMYAEGFKPNHSELFPLPQSVVDANPNLTQDYGY